MEGLNRKKPKTLIDDAIINWHFFEVSTLITALVCSEPVCSEPVKFKDIIFGYFW